MPTHRYLVEMIRSAWEGVTPPDGGNISKPTYDDEGVSEYFTGKTWEGHTARELRILDFAPSVFTDEAFAYYLPAYLIADIEDPKESDTNAERVLFWLSQENQRPSENRGPSVIAKLSELQRSALCEYVAFIQEREHGLYEEECVTILRLLDEADRHV
jgi:hypothetical protein